MCIIQIKPVITSLRRCGEWCFVRGLSIQACLHMLVGVCVYTVPANIFNLAICFYCICMNTFVLICTYAGGCFNAANFKAHSAGLWGFQETD